MLLDFIHAPQLFLYIFFGQKTQSGDDDIDEDAIEALFRQLEEDLKNDLSDDDGDDEITE